MITRLLDTTIDEEPLSEETLATIERSLEEYREGIYYTHEELLRELGVTEDPDTSEIVDIADIADISDTSQTVRKPSKTNTSRTSAKTKTDA